jgi:hypothetical protein
MTMTMLILSHVKIIVGQKQFFFEFRLTSNPGIPEYRDLAFCLRIPTLVSGQPAVECCE